MELNNLWFVCDKCGTAYDDHMEEIVEEEDLLYDLEWANRPTLEKDKWEAITKAKIRIEHENKKCESKG